MRILCRVLTVSVGGFYAWVKRPPCAREREDGELIEHITSIKGVMEARASMPNCAMKALVWATNGWCGS